MEKSVKAGHFKTKTLLLTEKGLSDRFSFPVHPHLASVLGWLLFKPKRQRDSGRNGILPGLLLLSDPGQLVLAYLLVRFLNPKSQRIFNPVFYKSNLHQNLTYQGCQIKLKSNRIWLSNRMFWPQPYADSIKWIFDTI
jgi:hypothetical protein